MQNVVDLLSGWMVNIPEAGNARLSRSPLKGQSVCTWPQGNGSESERGRQNRLELPHLGGFFGTFELLPEQQIVMLTRSPCSAEDEGDVLFPKEP